jgi:maltose O-acetyltransferase
MSLAGRVLLRLRQLSCSVSSFWRQRWLQLFSGSSLRYLEIGAKNRFNVPVRSDGSGKLVIGNSNTFGWSPATRLGNGEILLQPRSLEAEIVIGNGNAFNNNVSLICMGKISMGDNCLIGDQVLIYDCDWHEIDPLHRNRSVGPIRPVTIGNNVWLGSRVMVLKGVTIGDNSVIAAASVVTKPIPANCLAVGNPAQIIRSIE